MEIFQYELMIIQNRLNLNMSKGSYLVLGNFSEYIENLNEYYIQHQDEIFLLLGYSQNPRLYLWIPILVMLQKYETK